MGECARQTRCGEPEVLEQLGAGAAGERDRLAGGELMESESGVVSLQRPQRGWGKPLLVHTLQHAARSVRAADPLATSLVKIGRAHV